MIIFDASYIVVYLHPNAPPAKDRNNKPVSQFRERVNNLVMSLNVPGKIIGIPTPALAEVLVRAGKSRGKFLYTLNDTYRFQLLPFGTRAAIEASELIEKIKAENKATPRSTWAKVKFDIQIVAIAKAETAKVIYSDDEDIERYGKRLGIQVIRICDLPVPIPVATETQEEDEDGQLQLGLKKDGAPTEESVTQLTPMPEPEPASKPATTKEPAVQETPAAKENIAVPPSEKPNAPAMPAHGEKEKG